MADGFLLKSTQIQKKSVGQNMNIWINIPPPPISVLVTSLVGLYILKLIYIACREEKISWNTDLSELNEGDEVLWKHFITRLFHQPILQCV